MSFFTMLFDNVAHSRITSILFPIVASKDYPLDREVVVKTLQPDPHLIVHVFFLEIIIAALIGAGLFEKGLSILEDRSYSGRRVGAYMLIVFGLRSLIALFTCLGQIR